MKYIQQILIAASLLGPALPILAATQPSAAVYADDAERIDAAGALAYRARLVLEKVQILSSKASAAELDKAERLSRIINLEALNLLTLIENQASESEIGEQLLVIEDFVLQLDATKRELQRRYPREVQLRNSLNDVRRTYFYLKQLLTGSI